MSPVELICRIPADHPALDGHFPGHPVVPGVVVLELVERKARELAGFRSGPSCWPRVKFMRPLLPDQAVELRIEGNAEAFSFSIRCEDGAIIARGRCRHGSLA